MSRTLLLSLGACWLTGCQVEFGGPESAARLDVLVTLNHAASATVTLEATLTPGFTASGDVRSIVNDNLRILGATLAPDEIADHGVRTYRHTMDIDPPTLADPTVSVDPPPVDGTSGTPDALNLDLVWRQGPDTIPSSRSADATLQLVNVRMVLPSAGRVWSLEVSQSTPVPQLISRFAALGTPPRTITVPSSVFTTSDGLFLDAHLEAEYATRSATPAGDYVAELVIVADVRWILDFTPPAPPASVPEGGQPGW